MDETVVVLGYHGTSKGAAEVILSQGFRASQNKYDWLGKGIYFWQDAPLRAWEWAEQQYGTECAVLVLRIDLTDCMDFFDSGWENYLSNTYKELQGHWEQISLSPPMQRGRAHRLDRAVLDYGVDRLIERGIQIKSVRGIFREGSPFYLNSALFNRSHVQIAVRDPSVILEIKRLKKR